MSPITTLDSVSGLVPPALPAVIVMTANAPVVATVSPGVIIAPKTPVTVPAA